jgi:hypothetical protein
MERQSRGRFGHQIALEMTLLAARRSAAALVESVYDGAKAIGDALVQSVETPSVAIRRPAGEDVEYRPGAIPFDPYAETIGLIWLRLRPALAKHDVIFLLRHEIGTVFLPPSGEYGSRVNSRRRCFAPSPASAALANRSPGVIRHLYHIMTFWKD